MQKPTNPVYLLLDSDSLYFRVCCVTKKKKDIRRFIDGKIRDILRCTEGTAYEMHEPILRIAIKGAHNFRDVLYPGYKGNRKPLEEDLKKALTYALEYVIDKHEAVTADYMEADDLCSIWANECREADIPYIVCHIDKDLNMIPGWHYNYVKDEHYDISEDEGYYRYSLQRLTGDSTDGIKGLPGVGPAKAKKLLEPFYGDKEALDKAVLKAWAGKEEALQHDTDLLRMLETWEELNEFKEKVDEHLQNKAPEREQDVRSQREEDVQDEGLSELPGGDLEPDTGDDLAF